MPASSGTIGRLLLVPLVGIGLLSYLGFVWWLLAGTLASYVGPWILLLGPLSLAPPLAVYWVAARRRRRRQQAAEAAETPVDLG